MKVRLPKDMRGYLNSRVLGIELNDFDIDIFLPALFFTILASGKGRARRTNDPTQISRYVELLAQHKDVVGFDDPGGSRVLDRLVRTSLTVTGRIGRGKRGEQILSTVPYTLLAHKPGFPTEGSRQRNVDTFIYQLLRDRLGGDIDLRDHLKRVFGRGVVIGAQPELGGTYDHNQSVELDTITRLSIAFLDNIEAVRPGGNRSRVPSSACPELAQSFADDLLRYLFAYHSVVPSQALIYFFQALINFELFVYTLKLVHAINALVQDPDTLPPAMQSPIPASPPDLYLDFTDNPRGLSAEMARACVRRDVETYERFLSSNLLLRQLDRYVETLRRIPARRLEVDRLLGEANAGPSYLQGLLQLQSHPVFGAQIEASARADETRIIEENTGDEEETEQPDWLDEVVAGARTDVERVVMLLVVGQRKNALGGYIRWFTGVGGITKPHGVLSGTSNVRTTWRYAPSNDLLNLLVQLAAAHAIPQGGDALERCVPESLRLPDFLTMLRARYGTLVDRPPEPFTGAEYASAARDNLRAMLGRLRQMGIFRDLSDDFTVQQLRPPYAGERIDTQDMEATP